MPGKSESGSTGRIFFFEKKKQKTFVHSASGSPERLDPDS
jgi:hypothetical protein